MSEYTPINVHRSLDGLIAVFDRRRIRYVVVDGPLEKALEPDDGRDVFLDFLIDSGLAGEMSWAEVSQTCQEVKL